MTVLDAEGVAGLLAAVESAEGAALPAALSAAATTLFGAAATARLYLADYRLDCLFPLGGGEARQGDPVAVEGSAAGRVFASGASSVEERGGLVVCRAVVAVRGDRLGVLEVAAGQPVEERFAGLVETVAAAAGRAVRLGTRSSDVFERAVRSQRLSLAAELQWQLLPGRGYRGEGFELAGQLEPAYHVAGDSFDWAVDEEQLWVAVFDGPGRGIAAAQTCALAVTAARNARRSGLGLADQAGMVDEALHAAFDGTVAVQALLARFDRRKGALDALAAGSPWLVRQRRRRVERVDLEPQLPFGMFEGTRYRVETAPADPGDRYMILSDGFHAARPNRRPAFGADKLPGVVRSLRLLPPAEAVRHLVGELLEYHVGTPIGDDAAAIVIDWRPEGPGSKPDRRRGPR
jgi:serine phosphatase RsbU (regulator of sigma subunit)